MALNKNAINPLAGQTVTISCLLTHSARLSVRIYAISGQREVVSLVDELRGAGTWSADWGGRNGAGDLLGNGIYLVVVKIDEDQRFVKKIAVMRH